MSTYTIHPRERHDDTAGWGIRHPVIATVAALAAAVLAGVLIGLLFGMTTAPPEATQHRGGHTLAKAAVVEQAAATMTGHTVFGGRAGLTRSPARGGFAVGHTAGAGDGFIDIPIGSRAPARGGFAGRSLGAGHVPGGALMRPTASE